MVEPRPSHPALDREVSHDEGLNKSCCSGNLFVVEWDNVHLKDHEDEGSFTFQAVLHRNGTVVFNYKDVSERPKLLHGARGGREGGHRSPPNRLRLFQIPVPLVRINSTDHPVKVGMSDAFVALVSPQTSGQRNDSM